MCEGKPLKDDFDAYWPYYLLQELPLYPHELLKKERHANTVDIRK
jgi:hypothetical protein